ncbi:hypothetical protein AB6N24_19365 [Cellulomonas sp. 179-A 4D5 NHS]|uniref:restriction system modified-DNA reader domain-containing protein n=1 Tax=Cellulomonas sp. 179-A 4D5 NHS TaxID=3142378 RepID=UPI0039A3035C
MPIFELDEGRPLLVQPMQPASSTFAPDTSALVADHLTALLGEQLFQVRVRHEDDEAPHLLALDAGGQPVVVDVVHLLDAEALVRALGFAGQAARLTRSDLARAYQGGREAFDADLAVFRDRSPLTAQHAPRTGSRLVLVCSEVDDDVSDALAFLRQPGRQVEVLQMGVVQGGDGRRYVDVSPVQLGPHRTPRPVEPAAMIVPAPVPAPLTVTGASAHESVSARAAAAERPRPEPVPVPRPSADEWDVRDAERVDPAPAADAPTWAGPPSTGDPDLAEDPAPSAAPAPAPTAWASLAVPADVELTMRMAPVPLDDDDEVLPEPPTRSGGFAPRPEEQRAAEERAAARRRADESTTTDLPRDPAVHAAELRAADEALARARAFDAARMRPARREPSPLTAPIFLPDRPTGQSPAGRGVPGAGSAAVEATSAAWASPSTAASGPVPLGASHGTVPGTAGSRTAAASGTAASGTAGSGTAASGTAASGTAASGTAASGTAASGTAASGTAAAGATPSGATPRSASGSGPLATAAAGAPGAASPSGSTPAPIPTPEPYRPAFLTDERRVPTPANGAPAASSRTPASSGEHQPRPATSPAAAAPLATPAPTSYVPAAPASSPSTLATPAAGVPGRAPAADEDLPVRDRTPRADVPDTPPTGSLRPASLAGTSSAPSPDPALAALAKGRGAVATLVWFRERRGQRLLATLRGDGLIELPDGRVHADPDEAAAEAANAEGAVDGWGSWRVGDGGPTLAEAAGVR